MPFQRQLFGALLHLHALSSAATTPATPAPLSSSSALEDACQGDASNACHGKLHSCSSLGLCVVDSTSGGCCSLSTSTSLSSSSSLAPMSSVARSNECNSDLDPTICTDVNTNDDTNSHTNSNANSQINHSNPRPPAPPPSTSSSPPTSPTASPTYYPTVPPTTSSAPTVTCYTVEVGVILDDYPGETRWEIRKSKNNNSNKNGKNKQNKNRNNGQKRNGNNGGNNGGNNSNTDGRTLNDQEEEEEDLSDASALIAKSPYYDPNNSYRQASDSHLLCLPRGRYTFTIYDSAGDGMYDPTPLRLGGRGEGKYMLSYVPTGELIASGGEFQYEEGVTFAIPYIAPGYKDQDGDGRDDRTGNVVPMVPLDKYGVPSCENEFGLRLETDDYGVETSWELRERTELTEMTEMTEMPTEGKGASGGGVVSYASYASEEQSGISSHGVGPGWKNEKIIASGGPYASSHTYDISYCLPPGKYTFIFYDWQCDGLRGNTKDGYFAVKIDGKEVYIGGGKRVYEDVIPLEFGNSLNGGDDGRGGGLSGAKDRASLNGARSMVGAGGYVGWTSASLALFMGLFL